VRRYITQPCAIEAGDDWWPGERCSLTVHEPEGKPQDTGLLNADGTPIYRVNTRAPIGFMRDEET
jgi:hypothetical protein